MESYECLLYNLLYLYVIIDPCASVMIFSTESLQSIP